MAERKSRNSWVIPGTTALENGDKDCDVCSTIEKFENELGKVHKKLTLPDCNVGDKFYIAKCNGFQIEDINNNQMGSRNALVKSNINSLPYGNKYCNREEKHVYAPIKKEIIGRAVQLQHPFDDGIMKFNSGVFPKDTKSLLSIEPAGSGQQYIEFNSFSLFGPMKQMSHCASSIMFTCSNVSFHNEEYTHKKMVYLTKTKMDSLTADDSKLHKLMHQWNENNINSQALIPYNSSNVVTVTDKSIDQVDIKEMCATSQSDNFNEVNAAIDNAIKKYKVFETFDENPSQDFNLKKRAHGQIKICDMFNASGTCDCKSRSNKNHRLIHNKLRTYKRRTEKEYVPQSLKVSRLMMHSPKEAKHSTSQTHFGVEKGDSINFSHNEASEFIYGAMMLGEYEEKGNEQQVPEISLLQVKYNDGDTQYVPDGSTLCGSHNEKLNISLKIQDMGTLVSPNDSYLQDTQDLDKALKEPDIQQENYFLDLFHSGINNNRGKHSVSTHADTIELESVNRFEGSDVESCEQLVVDYTKFPTCLSDESKINSCAQNSCTKKEDDNVLDILINEFPIKQWPLKSNNDPMISGFQSDKSHKLNSNYLDMELPEQILNSEITDNASNNTGLNMGNPDGPSAENARSDDTECEDQQVATGRCDKGKDNRTEELALQLKTKEVTEEHTNMLHRSKQVSLDVDDACINISDCESWRSMFQWKSLYGDIHADNINGPYDQNYELSLPALRPRRIGLSKRARTKSLHGKNK